ncbi:MAG TPA: NAD(P)-dependent alcohol dehydrogenase [Phenylobacterium sp.]|uniref:NAD(P)-dependent alcohol dehydrogenase n=1 Tax=Phenylobacterium sp. TaxID=1871053 RepID=UPI002B466D0F|nr:NAD(P)-dependent alcohol dehydrogenase [Phenylobacterium sp.]HKR89624.1 NAD(P)-dependent alcohol dehydrogenase [Phenylobacterium sp.]
MTTDTAVLAAVAREPNGPFSLEHLTLAAPEADEVLVRVAGVGVCHTDLVARDQIIPVPLPAVLGHEGAGVVERVGRNVTAVQPGDRVVLSFLYCESCRPCSEHAYPYCDHFGVLNFSGRRSDGRTALRSEAGPVHSHFFGQSSFATFALAHRRNVVKVESELPIELLGPLGCGVQTGAGAVLRSLDCQPGSSIAIFGAGAVGMSAVMAAKVRRCNPVIVIEPVAARRTLALELGATHAVDPAEGDVGEAIRRIVRDGVRYSLDLSGVPSVIETAITSLAKRGVCALTGSPQKPGETFAIRSGLFVTMGAKVVGVMEGDSDPHEFIPELLALQAAGSFPFERMIRTYQLSEINEAVADHKSGKVVKPVLVMP